MNEELAEIESYDPESTHYRITDVLFDFIRHLSAKSSPEMTMGHWTERILEVVNSPSEVEINHSIKSVLKTEGYSRHSWDAMDEEKREHWRNLTLAAMTRDCLCFGVYGSRVAPSKNPCPFHGDVSF